MTNREEIYEQVVRFVADQLYMTPDEIDPDVKLAELGFDSLDAVEFAVAMDEPFGIEITDEEMWSGMFASMTTNDVVEYFLKRMADEIEKAKG